MKVRSLYRRPSDSSVDTPRRLADLVRLALEKGGAPSVAVILREERVDLLPLKPVVDAGVGVPVFLAGLSQSETAGASDVLAVGVMGTFHLKRRGDARGAPVAMVFLEWSDCSWWHWRGLIEADGRTLREDTQTVATASEGAAKPRNLGGLVESGPTPQDARPPRSQQARDGALRSSERAIAECAPARKPRLTALNLHSSPGVRQKVRPRWGAPVPDQRPPPTTR